MEAKTAKGARAWLELATSAQLPILKVSAQLLTKQIKSGASLADMAHTIERDPALCLHLFLAANRKNKNSDVQILNLNQVMTMLGMQGVIHYIKQAPKMSLHKSDAQQKGYLQAQANSTLAGHLVEHWAGQTHSGSAEKLKWATILSGAPIWNMWLVGYGVMANWQYQVRHEFAPTAKVETQLFGCLLEDIFRMLGRRMQLPELSQQLLERAEWPSLRQWGQMLSPKHMDFSDDDHQLRLLKSKPITTMLLLNHLAYQVQWGWMTAKSLRDQHILGHLSGLDVNQVIQQNHQLAVRVSRGLIAEQVLPPGVSLLWPNAPINQPAWAREPFTCWEKDPNPGTSVRSRGQPKGERILTLVDVPPREMNTKILNEVLADLLREKTAFHDIHSIFKTCNKALHQGMGMGRGFICVLNKTSDCLRPVYCFGIDKDDPLRQVTINLHENRLFTKLLAKSASFRIDADNAEQAINMLHPDIVKTLKRKNCMLMSLFSAGKPIGVVYSDVSSEEQAITDKEYQIFKKVCQGTMHALEKYAKR